MTEQALTALLEAPDGWRRVVRDLVDGHPNAHPLEVSFALVSAGNLIEEFFATNSPSRKSAGHAMRLAALFSADLYAMHCLRIPAVRAADMRGYWALHDPYFLTL